MIKKVGKRQIQNILFYTFLLVMIGSMCDFQTTNAKYKKDLDNALIYNNELYKVDQGPLALSFSTNLTTTTEVVAVAELVPNDIGVSPENNLYTIEVSSGCHVELIESNGVLYHNDINTELKINDTVFFGIICPTTNKAIKVGDVYRISAMVYEQVVDPTLEGESRFIYKHRNFVDGMPKQEEVDPVPSGEVLEVYDDLSNPSDVYEKLLAWLMKYVDDTYAGSGDSITIKEYVTGYIAPFKNDIFTEDLMGLDIKSESVGGQTKYTFTREDNFIGYVLSSVLNQGQFMYFSTKNPDEIRSIFEYYLTTYIYPGNVEGVGKVIDYLNSLGFDIADYVINGGELPPAISNCFRRINDGQILLNPRVLLSLATAPTGDPGLEENPGTGEVTPPAPTNSVVFASRSDMLTSFQNYMKDIKVLHPEYTVSDSTIEKIANDSDIQESMVKNNTESATATAFQDFFLVLDDVNQNYVIAKAYSDGVTSNLLDLSSLSLTSDMVKEAKFVNKEDNTLEITITLDAIQAPGEVIPDPSGATSASDGNEITEGEKSKVDVIVQIFDQYFGITSASELGYGIYNSVITKEEDLLTLTYTIQKN